MGWMHYAGSAVGLSLELRVSAPWASLRQTSIDSNINDGHFIVVGCWYSWMLLLLTCCCLVDKEANERKPQLRLSPPICECHNGSPFALAPLQTASVSWPRLCLTIQIRSDWKTNWFLHLFLNSWIQYHSMMTFFANRRDLPRTWHRTSIIQTCTAGAGIGFILNPSRCALLSGYVHVAGGPVLEDAYIYNILQWIGCDG